jgi:hypothetical protein
MPAPSVFIYPKKTVKKFNNTGISIVEFRLAVNFCFFELLKPSKNPKTGG